MDTLAFNRENKSLVLIEYKRGNSYSVIDQRYSYLTRVLNNKVELILEYSERKGKSLKRDKTIVNKESILSVLKAWDI
ncbi:MAG: hypothetical protein ACRDAG_12520 [Cetobacterium somerae]|uniref:hypothetical protein n=1 Tax=Cetobacterium somerae TaxID=188913 RepID=UPI003F2EDFF2